MAGLRSVHAIWIPAIDAEALLDQNIFDPYGDIYSCFEGAGDLRARIGKYDPEFIMFLDRLAEWSKFETLRSPYCTNFRFSFVCAGGCPWHTIKRMGQRECVPIKQQVNLAWNYFTDLII